LQQVGDGHGASDKEEKTVSRDQILKQQHKRAHTRQGWKLEVEGQEGNQLIEKNIKKLHQIQKQSQQLVTKYLTKRCEQKETASQVGSLASGRQAKCQYSEAQLLRAEVTNIWSRYTVAYSLQGYVQDKF
jgi:hypothetical protein